MSCSPNKKFLSHREDCWDDDCTGCLKYGGSFSHTGACAIHNKRIPDLEDEGKVIPSIKKILTEPSVLEGGVAPGTYRDYTGEDHDVLGMAWDIEKETWTVVYRSCEDGTMYAQPPSMFTECVEGVLRFRRVV